MKNSGEMMGQKQEMTMKTTLVEVTPEKAVIEVAMSMMMNGQKMDQPAQKQDIPAAAPAGQPTDPMEAAKKMGAEVKDLGEENVSISGTSYTCKVMETKLKQGESNITSKSWFSKDVPGMMVKAETTMDGQMAGTSKLEVTEVMKK